jgi:PAS domain S-box-containing protein
VKSDRSGCYTLLIAAAALQLAGLALVRWAGAIGYGVLVAAAAADTGFLAWVAWRIGRRVAASEEALARTRGEAEARGLAAAATESSEDAVISEDLGGRVVGWNPAAARIFGFGAEEAIGARMDALVPAGVGEAEAAALERIRRGGPAERMESRRTCKDGSALEVSMTIAPARDPGGRLIGLTRFARVLTGEKKLEHEMQLAITELRDIKAALDEHSIVAITDASGRITYVNEKFCAISKYSREELIGKDHRIINSRFHPKEFFRDLWQTIGRGGVWRGEIRNCAKDGSLYWVETTIYPRIDPSTGKPSQYIAIRTDITQRKSDEVELQRSAAELAEKNKELETIVYTVSHDLRSPLVNVQGFSRQLVRACEKIRGHIAAAAGGAVAAADLKPQVDAAIPQAVRFITAGVSKMDLLLAGLLRYSRLGRVVMNIVPLEMGALLDEIVAAMRFQLNEAKADVQIGVLPPCMGDSVHTSQVFANLIDNALKYRDPDRPLRIAITGEVRDGRAVYSVADNGIGIAHEHQGKVFEIFHRLNPEVQAGEGLGLTIAQRVLERQKGTIWVDSQEGRGSTFYVSMPLAESAQAKAP